VNVEALMSRNRSRKNRGGQPDRPKDSNRAAFNDAAYEWKIDHVATRNQGIDDDEAAGGISNRELDHELSLQERLPERGLSKGDEEEAGDRGEELRNDRE
jgi:hypothetical protein